MFISMAVLTIGVVVLAISAPQVQAQAAGKVPYQQPWPQHAVGPAIQRQAASHQPATPSQYYYPAVATPYSAPAYPYSAPAKPYSIPAKAINRPANPYSAHTLPSKPSAKPFASPAKPYSIPAKALNRPAYPYSVPTQQHQSKPFAKPYAAPAKPYAAPVKPYSTAVKQYAVPAQHHSNAAKPYPAAVRPYTTPAKQYQRPAQSPVKKQSYPSAPKKPQRPVAVKSHAFPAGVTQYQYPGGQVQHYAPAKRVQGSKQKHGQVIKKRLTPAQLRQIQQWQIAVQFPPGTQVQPGTGGSPPGPEVPGHIWIQVPVPPQGSYPPQQPVGPPIAPPAPVEPVPEVPVEPQQPEVIEEAELPQETFEPEQPEGPFEPEQPQGPYEPEQPEVPLEPEQPDYPEEPAQTGETSEPEQPQVPLEPEQPDYPEEPAQTGETSEPEQPQEPLPVPGNQPIQPFPEEVTATEEHVPENPDSGAVASGGEDSGQGTWTEEPWGDTGSQELTEPDPAMALLLESCKEPRGQFPSPSACNKFVNCWDGFAVEQQCPGGLVFSETGFCDFPDNVDCGSRESAKPGVGGGAGGGEGECPTLYGHYRSLESCGLFYVCVGGNPVKFECPEGLNYNTELGICDYPSRVDCGGTPSDRPPPEEPVTEVSEIAEAPESSEIPVDSNTSDPAKKFFKLKRVQAKPAVRPWPVHRAPARGTPY